MTVIMEKSNAFNGIAPEKINLLTEILKKSKNVSSENMVSFLLGATADANARGINFTDAETSLIINALKKNMNPEQISQMDNIIRISRMLQNSKGNPS